VAQFRRHAGGWIGTGRGTEGIEVRQITGISGNTLTLGQPLAKAHAAGQWAGYEFVRETWYPDVVLDNIFWHDHVDGIHTWTHGLVGQLIIEPKGSTYTDPKTGAPVDSGTIVDIHTTNPLVNGVVNGSFREMALWTIDDSPDSPATFNLKAEPWADRLAENPDPSLLFSSYTHGDPITPLLYVLLPGFVLTSMAVSQTLQVVIGLAFKPHLAKDLICGVALLLCVAGIIEGFISPQRLGIPARAALGALSALETAKAAVTRQRLPCLRA